MRLDDLTLFVTVVDHGSFTAGAAALALPKQTVSQRIGSLERTVGAKLLHRTTRSVRPSVAGEALLVRARAILRLAEEARADLRAHTTTPTGLLRVTCDPLLAEIFVGPLAMRVMTRWPLLRVEVHTTRERLDLAAHRVEVAFRVGPKPEEALVVRRLGDARVGYFAAPAYVQERGEPRTVDELAAHAIVAVADGGAPARLPIRDGEGMRVIEVTPRLQTGSLPLALEAVAAGFGIGMFPELVVAEALRSGRLVRVLPDAAVDAGGIWAIWPPGPLSARARALVDEIDRTPAPWR